ncbi:MAG: stage II sporulation protein M, partial [Terriglobales bacterium]
ALMLFTNGVMLGAVAARYVRQGFGWFLAGWLLPHGAFEIPSVLIAGQAGFLLAGLLLAGGRETRRERLRRRLPEVLTLFGGLSCLLLWAGIMEAYFSQHHAPEIRYGVKALVGLSELLLLGCYLAFAGRHERS